MDFAQIIDLTLHEFICCCLLLFIFVSIVKKKLPFLREAFAISI